MPAPSNAWGPLPPHATPLPRRRIWVVFERLLFTIALIGLGYYGYVTVEAALYQTYETRELDTILRSAPSLRSGPATSTTDAAPPARRREPSAGSLIGRLEIPRLGVSAIVRAGSDARTLRLAVGHIPGTALPGERANVGLAGHRDTFFRRLRDIRPDDEIRIATPEGTFTYRVERTNIVDPQDVWVLDPGERPVLTLITCYPFSYIGAAPQRFVVRARLEPTPPV